MTRQEITNTRDLTFSNWIRERLPDSNTGFLVSDLDFIFENYKTKKVMFLEVKTRGADLRYWQTKLFNNLDRWIRNGIDDGWIYLGFHTVQFENTFFNDGKCYLEGKETTEQELINIFYLIN